MPRSKTAKVELRKEMIKMLLDKYGCMTIGDIMAMTDMSHTHVFYVLQHMGLPRKVVGNVLIACAAEEHMRRYMDAMVDSLTCAACRMGLRYIWPGRLALYRETWRALQEELERRLAAAGYVVPKAVRRPSAAALTFMRALLDYAAETGRAEVIVRKKRHDVIKIACPPDCTPSRPSRRLRRHSI
jgi:hypothetical protein